MSIYIYNFPPKIWLVPSRGGSTKATFSDWIWLLRRRFIQILPVLMNFLYVFRRPTIHIRLNKIALFADQIRRRRRRRRRRIPRRSMADLEASSAWLRHVDRLRTALRLLQPSTSWNQRRRRRISSRLPHCRPRSSSYFIGGFGERNRAGKLD